MHILIKWNQYDKHDASHSQPQSVLLLTALAEVQIKLQYQHILDCGIKTRDVSFERNENGLDISK